MLFPDGLCCVQTVDLEADQVTFFCFFIMLFAPIFVLLLAEAWGKEEASACKVYILCSGVPSEDVEILKDIGNNFCVALRRTRPGELRRRLNEASSSKKVCKQSR